MMMRLVLLLVVVSWPLAVVERERTCDLKALLHRWKEAVRADPMVPNAQYRKD